MKKIEVIKLIILFFFVSITEKGYAQIQPGDAVTTSVASPSMAAMSQYTDVPMSLSTGFPEIGIPLFNAPVSDGISWPLGLSYNVRSVQNSETTSDVGNGWSFFGAGVIYKKIILGLDECYDNTGAIDYKKNEFDDLYYYNLSGLSGKFRIKRDTVNNTFQLVNLTPNHAKIEYIRDSNTTTFKADSFTITSDTGFKYIFNIPDVGRSICGEVQLGGTEYKTAYYLSKILNPVGMEVAVMEYDEKKKYKGTTNFLLSVQHKLKTITSRNGQVTFNYVYDDTLEPKKDSEVALSDPYSLRKLTMKNAAGNDVLSYVFNYTMVSKGNAASSKLRILNSVVKNDKNGYAFENNSFVYDSSTGEGKLKKMISPTGGVTEYNYENADIYFNYNDPALLSYISSLPTISYPDIQHWVTTTTGIINTTQNLSYTITIPGNTSEKKNFKIILGLDEYFYPEPLPGFPQKPNDLKLTLKRGTEVIIPTFSVTSGFSNEYSLYNHPGIYTLEITSTGGATGGGSFSASEIQFKPGPYRNAVSANDLRIKNIKTYKSINAASPFRTVNYEYDSFDSSNSSSGYLYESEKDSDFDEMGQYILYRNIKEFETGKGAIHYTFKTPDDYPKQQNGGTTSEPLYFWPYFNITKNGLISKKEIYDEQNSPLTSELYDYELDTYSDQEYNMNWTTYKITSKPSYVKKRIVTSKAYFPNNGILESVSETLVGIPNLKPYYVKNTADGDVSERFLTYATAQPEYAHLVNANMTGVPVITEEKKNGKIISKTVTKYDNLSLLPTSVYSANIADGSMRATVKMDVYDHRGNLVQISSEAGKPVAFIFGYDKTQVIAKIEGATYNDAINNSLVTAAVNASNFDNVDPAMENNLINALDNLRKDSSMANYQITTYTYNPLQGLTTMTSANGQREIYEYDDAGRLKTIKKAEKDAAGNTVVKKLKEYQYHYKN
ncbi:RHS repeat domain-containing protein [Chryseobacterium sp. NKUCC03_KSP]|uniref:RHS repeat domain-containing protein n=1 Tax=Chryseobacterium sp. NKUCC03_KSP TaxID=2842125 RepID=UPI001C5B0133|nr:RHS repeat domain-containing protein [Chryseobacterium sp. NKUCC03_KSP]MBW3522140.1 RHS repeat protein [Chryseobacterium sp. NKUCC03_KSP]